MRKKTKISLALGLLGVALALVSLALEGRISDPIGGMLMGIGAGLVGFGFSQWRMWRGEEKDPQKMRQSQVEANDERNVAIREKAAYTSWYWTTYLLWILFFVTLITSGGMYVAFVSAAIVLHCVFLMINMRRWGKKL